MTGEIPEGQAPSGTASAFVEVQRLLAAEARRRGVSVAELVDALARESRRPVLAEGNRRGGDAKTVGTLALTRPVLLVDGIEGALTAGAGGSGKTSQADLLRACLDAHGARYREEVVTHDGADHVEFRVERPEAGR
ncbi:hypothetical protein ACFC5T_17145 [Streptomyces sp. NPDC055961]|uniref:hypothetical protein n=1 Tax=Streptomyces sp. NPDC055961 TaxID=3345666 RepID=UPI0035DA06C4